jgi:hypothetical protein
MHSDARADDEVNRIERDVPFTCGQR